MARTRDLPVDLCSAILLEAWSDTEVGGRAIGAAGCWPLSNHPRGGSGRVEGADRLMLAKKAK